MAVATLLPNTSHAWLNNISDAVEMMREIHPDMTLNQVMVFLTVAVRPGVTQREIMETLGVADSSASRIVAILSDYGNRGTGPFKLIELVEDKRDRRNKLLHLTKKGQSLASKLAAAASRGHK